MARAAVCSACGAKTSEESIAVASRAAGARPLANWYDRLALADGIKCSSADPELPVVSCRFCSVVCMRLAAAVLSCCPHRDAVLGDSKQTLSTCSLRLSDRVQSEASYASAKCVMERQLKMDCKKPNLVYWTPGKAQAFALCLHASGTLCSQQPTANNQRT
jgi:hypothetical protein